ncbi:MAG: TraB/GumN family protein [Gemmatimonadaceae bacterium]|nr:TraB/GumN family protein [Chitinophagaceae bacterium]
MKKTILLLFIAACGCCLAGKSQSKKLPKKASDVSKTEVNTLLWEITGPGLSQPSYLFGTMHLLCADDAKLSDSLRYTIDKASQIYFEIDLDNLMETLGAMKYLNMKDNKKLSDLLTEDEYKRVKEYFSKNKTMLPLSMLERMKPYLVSALISESKFPCDAKDGMEQVIMKEAKKTKKVVNGLETIEYQAGIFDSIPYAKQAHDLVQMIDSSGVKTDSVDTRLLDVYRQQDLNKMLEMTSQEEGMGEYMDLLLNNRNENWVKKMPAIMKEKQTLFAVGAGHLPGNRGVISLLRKAGYAVRPMKHKPGLLTVTN